MKKRNSFFVFALTMIVTFGQAVGQTVQKIFPTSKTLAVDFAANTKYADNTIFANDPAYKSTEAAKNCATGYGAMSVITTYPSITVKQIIYPKPGNSVGNKFANHFSYKNNVLVCSSELEDYSASVKQAGGFYVFKRTSSGNNFSKVNQRNAPSPVQYNQYTKAGLATNGTNVVVYDHKKGTLDLYTISGSSINFIGAKSIGTTAGVIQGITDNNIVVLQSENAVRLFKISGTSFSEIVTSSISLTGADKLGGRASVDKNTIVFDAYTTYPSGAKSGFIRIVKLGSSSVISTKNIGFPLGMSYSTVASESAKKMIIDVDVMENTSIAVAFSSVVSNSIKRVALLRYKNGAYRLADIVESNATGISNTSNFGGSVAVSPSKVFVGDPNDRTNYKSSADPCLNQASSGAIYVFDGYYPDRLRSDSVNVITTLFPEFNDKTGRNVAIKGNYALVSHHYSSDVNSLSGAVSLMKKENGVWNFMNKMYSTSAQSSELFGSDVSISDKFAAISAIGREKYIGGVFVYPILTSSGVKIEDNTSPAFISCPDRIEGIQFGTAVATDGNYLAISAWKNSTKGKESGAVYIYRYTGSSWAYVQTLYPPTVADYQNYGTSIALKGDYLVVGARKDDNVNGTDAGAAYVYKLSNGTFNSLQKIIPNGKQNYQYFGESVSISSDYILISGVYDLNYPNMGFVYMGVLSNGFWNMNYNRNYSAGNTRYGQESFVEGSKVLVGMPGLGSISVFDRTNSSVYGSLKMAGPSTFDAYSVGLSGDDAIAGDANNNGSNYGNAYLWNYSETKYTNAAREDDNAYIETEESAEIQEAAVYPNPANGEFVMLKGVKEVEKIDAYSSLGEFAGSLDFTANEVDIRSLKPGLYLLQIKSAYGDKTLKLQIN